MGTLGIGMVLCSLAMLVAPPPQLLTTPISIQPADPPQTIDPESKPPGPTSGAYGCLAGCVIFPVGLYLWFLVGLGHHQATEAYQAGRPAPAIVATSPAQEEALKILREDGYSVENQAKMLPILTDAISTTMTRYSCQPGQVTAAARKVKAAMVRGTTLTAATHDLSTNIQGASTVDEAAAILVNLWSSKR